MDDQKRTAAPHGRDHIARRQSQRTASNATSRDRRISRRGRLPLTALLALALPLATSRAQPDGGSKASIPLDQLQPPVVAPESMAVEAMSSRAATQVEEARRLIGERRFTEASLKLERALRYDPRHPVVHRTLAEMHLEAGNLQRARSHAEKAREANPDDITAWYVTGRCQLIDDDLESATVTFRKALLCSDRTEHTGIVARCSFHLAETLRKLGYDAAAVESYARFQQSAMQVEIDDAAVASLTSLRIPAADGLADLLENRGRWSEAATALESVLRLEKRSIDRRLRCAELWLRAGEAEKALAVANEAPSDDPRVTALLTEIHEKAGTPEAVVTDLQHRLEAEPDNAALVLQLADTLVRLERVGEAVDVLRDFVRNHGDADTVRMRLVETLARQGSWRSALTEAAQGLHDHPSRESSIVEMVTPWAQEAEAVRAILADDGDWKPESAQAMYLCGVLARAAGHTDDARNRFQSALEQDETFIPARLALATSYFDEYRYDQALAIAGRRDPDKIEDARLERLLGKIYERLDNLEKAEQHLKAAIMLDRDDTESMLKLARALWSAGQGNRALLQLRALLERAPDHDEARELLAFRYVVENQEQEWRRQMEYLSQRGQTPTVRARADAMMKLRSGEGMEAFREAMTAAIEAHGPDARSWIALAGSLLGDQPALAAEYYAKALALDPGNEDAGQGLWESHQLSLNYESAVEVLQRFLPRRPNRDFWRRDLFNMYSFMQDHESALAVAQKQAARDGLDDESRNSWRERVITALERLHREDEALTLLKTWLEEDPESISRRRRLAQGYLNYERPEEAVTIYRGLLSEHGEEYRRDLIGALVQAEHFDRAAQLALDELFADPKSDQTVAWMATVLAEQGRVEDAITLIDNHLLYTSRRERFQDLATSILGEHERYEESLRRTERQIDQIMSMLRRLRDDGQLGPAASATTEERIFQPDEPQELQHLRMRLLDLQSSSAVALIGAERFLDARERLERWLEDAPDPRVEFRVLSILRFLAVREGKEDESMAMTERALRILPSDVGLKNDVAYGWIDRGVKLDEAVPMIRSVLANAPMQGAYLDTYGWLLYKKGDFAGAKKWLVRSVKAQREPDGVVLDHLGDALWHLGETEEAARRWRAAEESVKARDEDLRSPDDDRVLREVPLKLKALETGERPPVAALAKPEHKENKTGGEQNDTPPDTNEEPQE